jgi:hypothetical protein
VSDTLWPWPWWGAIVTAVMLLGVVRAAAKVAASRRATVQGRVEAALRAAGFEPDDDTFCVPDGHVVLVGSREQLAIVDTAEARVIQLLPVRGAQALKLYDGHPDRIALRITTRGDAESRKIVTRSLIAFARLFVVMTAAHKPIVYVEE